MGGPDRYALLDVRSDASAPEIRRAYRRLARQHHPRPEPASRRAKRFAELAQPYAILNDPARRARYDQTLHPPAPARPSAMSRSPVPQRAFRRGILELSPSEARRLARHPLTLRYGEGRTIVLPSGASHMDEITLLYDGRPVILTIHLQRKS